ncbi:receptor-interacting serine/threonine-protein kinase 3 [Amphiprion ocellaris]|uniref:Protein kinase domain-containing protein n=1 Tax=Amphiprion ocellaris TaxID=80972 RepID=A0A3Q1D413_AMPOC|nr:receptor-interacting serine/threonine-protein kinase 3 [Amphiprion ocellaris]XP_054863714.1 receptor-interacting serine/threonine-protein kinase 3 [Amphiprion ocellaris]
MAKSNSPAPVVIGESSLKGWTEIGEGGFGKIYKARHHRWCCDVAIKLLRYDDGNSSSLLREVEMMCLGKNPYVIQVLGIFEGRPPFNESWTQLGLVMEFMDSGSLASLQKTLNRPPPWPLAFRLVHQVALGINFLHSLTPALLHLDLKPSNVLLDSSLNAKLTDFGLARISHSSTRTSKKGSEEEGGTLDYMPPEAFSTSYCPTRASDIYSYGILLWSIVTGKQPYPHAFSSVVKFRIPRGDRPLLDEIRRQAAGCAGLSVLMELMMKCWSGIPSERPSSFECATMTEELFKMHKHALLEAVRQVQDQLSRKEDDDLRRRMQRVGVTEASVSFRGPAGSDNVPTGPSPVQEMADGFTNHREKTKLRASPPPAGPFHGRVSPADSRLKPSSVHPIHSSPSSPSTSRSAKGRAAKSFLKEDLQHYQRQLSSPGTFSDHPSPARNVNINISNGVGVQIGNNNTMHICDAAYFSERRKRHPTAPQ